MRHETLIARAIVAYEVALMRGQRASKPLPTITVDSVLDTYGKEWTWAAVMLSDRFSVRRLVRKALEAEFRLGNLCKVRDEEGRKVKQGTCVVYIHSGAQVSRTRDLGWTREWGV